MTSKFEEKVEVVIMDENDEELVIEDRYKGF